MTAAPTSRSPRDTTARGTRTKERILDAAEAAFAEHDYDTVTFRDLAAEAGVQFSLVTYYFGSKDVLLEEVVKRRFGVLDGARRTKLAELLERGDAKVRELLEAFFEPLYRMIKSRDPGWRNYARLIARVNFAGHLQAISKRYFDDTALRYIDALRAVLIDADELDVVRAFGSSIGLMTLVFAHDPRVRSLSGGRIDPTDFEPAYSALLTYTTAGVLAATNKPPAAPIRRAANDERLRSKKGRS